MSDEVLVATAGGITVITSRPAAGFGSWTCRSRTRGGCSVVALTIRNVPEGVRDELAARAARSGRSLQEYVLRQLIDLASQPTAEDVIARARARVRAAGSQLTPEQILADRDAERR